MNHVLRTNSVRLKLVEPTVVTEGQVVPAELAYATEVASNPSIERKSTEVPRGRVQGNFENRSSLASSLASVPQTPAPPQALWAQAKSQGCELESRIIGMGIGKQQITVQAGKKSCSRLSKYPPEPVIVAGLQTNHLSISPRANRGRIASRQSADPHSDKGSRA